ncbi:hypothetical protein ACPCKV_17945 [Streptomyces koyangensis]|uniref:hypothetical protein n=1 Tax=Streptomyces koyangensis TaxID=188770 RepID=UPI003C2EE844
MLGLATAAGHDRLTVHRRPTVELLVLGDELLASGLPADGPELREADDAAAGELLPAELDPAALAAARTAREPAPGTPRPAGVPGAATARQEAGSTIGGAGTPLGVTLTRTFFISGWSLWVL